MQNKNSLLRGSYLSLCILLLLFGYTIAYEHLPWLSENFKQIDIIPLEKKKLIRNTTKYQINALQNRKQQLQKLKIKREKDSIQIVNTRIKHRKEFHNFFQALYTLHTTKKGNCRIAYYGDSMIEGDLMTMTLRRALQDKFGGKGIGFLPLASDASRFRSNIKHTFSDNWIKKTLLQKLDSTEQVGIAGEIYYSDSTGIASELNYETQKYKHLKTFPETKLFYGMNTKVDSTAILTCNQINYPLYSQSEINTLLLLDKDTTQLNLLFKNTNNIPFFGISSASKNGVHLDNFAIRGNSGATLNKISSKMLQYFNKEMQYDLIVLQFGINVASGYGNFNWYENRIKKIIRHFKNNIPNASVLVISAPDISWKDETGVLKTNPSIPAIVKAQETAANAMDAAFFNLYEAMGGENSMVQWVDSLGYANKDYTHFNYKGAKFAAEKIHAYLMQHFKDFKNYRP
ncbi:MAG: GDSL-type esterase/lipase family protein [Flavicella sp.]